ncbi:hypothetical protein BX661DRAFT_185794, partial [Kickxella alabastrina]|uniref:uncharacterized protein n=1 Tax=Kickxella alabastrina TaxID=61397 RepID=UPI002220C3DC
MSDSGAVNRSSSRNSADHPGNNAQNIKPAPTTHKKKFQRRPPTREYLQQNYEQNLMGASAGFFGAIWAGWIMGEYFSTTFITLSYPNLDHDGRYHFGPKDIALAVFIASKMIFIRAWFFRYFLRNLQSMLLRSNGGGAEFVVKQEVAELCATAVTRLSSLILSLCVATWRVSADTTESADMGVGFAIKVFVLVQCAARLAGIIVELLEGEDTDGHYARIASLYLTSGVLVSAGMLGNPGFAGFAAVVVGAVDIGPLVEAGLGIARTLGCELEEGCVGCVCRVFMVAVSGASAATLCWLFHNVGVSDMVSLAGLHMVVGGSVAGLVLLGIWHTWTLIVGRAGVVKTNTLSVADDLKKT